MHWDCADSTVKAAFEKPIGRLEIGRMSLGGTCQGSAPSQWLRGVKNVPSIRPQLGRTFIDIPGIAAQHHFCIPVSPGSVNGLEHELLQFGGLK
jgi:hypothetical protein